MRRALLHKVQSGLSQLELIHVPHEIWPLQIQHAHPQLHSPLKILVLDSSFNPPTLAHLALANTPAVSPPEYDAKLLLLSVKNADKSLKSHDASYLQRLDMMSLLAKDVNSSNVAIAVTDQPTFVAKSSCLRSFLRNRFLALSAAQNVPICDTQLHFLLGLDTLQRLVQPRYYSSDQSMVASLSKFLSPPPDGEDSYIVCANRVVPDTQGISVESSLLSPIHRFMTSSRISFINLTENLESCSSSEVRDAVARPGSGSSGWQGRVTDSIAKYVATEHLYDDPSRSL